MIVPHCCCGEGPGGKCCELQPVSEANVGFPEGIGISATPKSSTIPVGEMCKTSGRCFDYEWLAESCWGGFAFRGRSSIYDYYGYRDVETWNCNDCNSSYDQFCEQGAVCTDMLVRDQCRIKCAATVIGSCNDCVFTPATTHTVELIGPCCDFCSPPASGLDCSCAQSCSTNYSSWSGSTNVPLDSDPVPICIDAMRCKLSPSEQHSGTMTLIYDVIPDNYEPASYLGVSSFTTFEFARDALADSIDHCAADQAACNLKYIKLFVEYKGEICANIELQELNDPCTNVCDCDPGEAVNDCICSSGKIELIIYERGERISSRQLTPGNLYCIVSTGNTDFRCYGADSNTVGHTFYATACDLSEYPIICGPICSNNNLYGDAVELFEHTFTLKGRGPSENLTQKFRDNFANGVWQYTKNITWDGVTNVSVAANAIVAGESYQIQTLGTTDFTLIGAPFNVVGYCFTATGAGTGTGTASLNGVRRLNNLITGYTISDADSSWFGGTRFIPAAQTWQPLHSDPKEEQVSLCSCDDICVDRLYNIWLEAVEYGSSSNPRIAKAIPAHYAQLESYMDYGNSSILSPQAINTQVDITSIIQDCPCSYIYGVVCDNIPKTLCVDSSIDFGGGYYANGSFVTPACAITPGMTGPAMIDFFNNNLVIGGLKFDWTVFLP